MDEHDTIMTRLKWASLSQAKSDLPFSFAVHFSYSKLNLVEQNLESKHDVPVLKPKKGKFSL